MNIESKLSGHWTDDQLIAYLYGVGPEDGHVHACPHCSSRLASMQSRWQEFGSEEVSSDLLAAQRRHIYARLTHPVRWWSRLPVRRLASGLATALVLSGGVIYYEQYQHGRDPMLSDAQLALDVSRIADSSEAQPTAPLQALFVE